MEWVFGVSITLGAVLSFFAVVKGLIPFFRWCADAGSRFMGAIDNLAGRDPRIDRATGKTIEGIPAIGERFTSIEDKLDALADTTTRLDTIDIRVSTHEKRLDGLDQAIGGIIANTFDRGAQAAIEAVHGRNDDFIEGDAG